MIKLEDGRILVATHNKGKIAEYADILGNQVDWLTLEAVGISDDVPETGDTFIANATLKAVAYAQQTGC